MNHIDFKGKTVIMRVDFNVPLDDNFKITDDTRITSAIPTIKAILEKGASVILMSHLGRPLKKLKEDGSINVKKFTLKHIIPVLSEHLGQEVAFIDDCLGEEAKKKSEQIKAGEVVLLENTRFYPGEEKGDKDMAQKLADLGDIYINDAFGTAHRAHASTAVIAQFFTKENKGFGYLMDSELENAKKVTDNPERPFTAIIGGAKVSDKMLLLERLSEIADNVIIGGGMAYTFMKAKGGKTGNSLVEDDRIELAKKLLDAGKGATFHLPEDSSCADAFSNDAKRATHNSMEIPDGWMGLDIGPEAIKQFSEVILKSKTILWNGPMGVFEMSHFAQGTKSVAEKVAEATKNGAYSLVGGGDSVAAVTQMELADDVSFVSTGGGAMLELLEGKDLPGVAAIRD
ncbi:MAG: phosphoglycerate kinase [Saprospiraceae bacterium]|nr:phosphoglycerate kinase [Saprospiraceae bacterium]